MITSGDYTGGKKQLCLPLFVNDWPLNNGLVCTCAIFEGYTSEWNTNMHIHTFPVSKMLLCWVLMLQNEVGEADGFNLRAAGNLFLKVVGSERLATTAQLSGQVAELGWI